MPREAESIGFTVVAGLTAVPLTACRSSRRLQAGLTPGAVRHAITTPVGAAKRLQRNLVTCRFFLKADAIELAFTRAA